MNRTSPKNLSRCIFALIFAFSSGLSAQAQLFWHTQKEPVFSEQAISNWSKLGYTGKPKIVNPRDDLGGLLNSGKCSRVVGELAKLVRDYGYVAQKTQSVSDSEKAKTIAEKIQFTLRKDEACSQVAGRAYAVLSIGLLHYSLFEFKPRDHRDNVGTVPPDLYLSLLAVYLANHGLIEVSAIPSSCGRKIVGYYDCASAKIVIDVSLAPIDVGAHLVHELDHLLHDVEPKVSQPEFDEAALRTRIGKSLEVSFGKEVAADFDAQWKNYLLTKIKPLKRYSEIALDELMSVLQSSYHEVLLGDIEVVNKKPAYRLANDLTLFDPNGPLYRLWKHYGIWSYVEVFQSFLSPLISSVPDTPEAKIFWRFTDRYVRGHSELMATEAGKSYDAIAVGNPQNVPVDIVEIQRRIFEAYFPGVPFDEDAATFLDPQFHPPATDGIGGREHEIHVAYESKIQGLPVASTDYSLNGLSVSLSRSVALTEAILEDLIKLEPLLVHPSASCTEFLSDNREGLLSPYLGSCPRDPIFPGGGGIRPGGGGIRPGGGGIRPADNGIHPCIDFKKGL